MNEMQERVAKAIAQVCEPHRRWSEMLDDYPALGQQGQHSQPVSRNWYRRAAAAAIEAI